MHEIFPTPDQSLDCVEYSYLDLLELHEVFQDWARDLNFSEAFRGLAQAAALAIAQCNEDDESTHPPVQAAVEQLFMAADIESERMDALSQCYATLDFTQDAATWRQTMIEMVPLLSDDHILGLRSLMMAAVAEFPPAQA